MQKMTEELKKKIEAMDSGEIMDFQIRLQVQCDMTCQEAADYINQVWEK